MENLTVAFGAIIIGDEILLGRRQDKHFPQIVQLLGERGLHVAWCLYQGDDRERLTQTLCRSLGSGDVVFCFGGIGVTPDDHTRQAAAAALGVELTLHPHAETEIRARFGDQTTPQRLLLGEFPEGSQIIPNPYNRIPGFSVRHHHFFPGFPVMAWPMLEWVLDTHYRALHHAAAYAEDAIVVWEGNEGALLPLMRAITERYPELGLFSLPSFGDENVRRHLELGVRGHPDHVLAAMQEIRAEVTRLGFRWENSPARV